MRKLLTALVIGTAGLALAACDVEQTEEGDMPEVNVEGGNLPEYDVDTPEVDVDAGTETVEVPDTIEVPDVDVDVEPADASEPE